MDAIRREADPGGCHSPKNLNTAELVKNIRNRHRKALKESEELKESTEKKITLFERIIRGQNVAVQVAQSSNHTLVEENNRLRQENADLQEKRRRRVDDFNIILKRLNDEKKSAEETAKTATDDVENRIRTVKEEYEKRESAAEDKNRQEQNSHICAKRMVDDELGRARTQLQVAEQQHANAIKAKDRTIHGLEAKIRQEGPKMISLERHAASEKQGLEKVLQDQRDQKDGEIITLKGQLRDSEEKRRALNGWKTKAEGNERIIERLTNQLDENKTELREHYGHIVDGLKLDLGGRDRSLEENEATNQRLRDRVAKLKSGEELQVISSQLDEAKKQLANAAKDKQDLSQSLQDQNREIDNLRSTIQAQEKGIREEAEKAAKEKADLKKQLEDAAHISERNLREEARDLEKQKDELAHRLKTAESAEKEMRTSVQSLLQQEKTRMAADHQRAVAEKDEKILRLSQELQDTKTRLDVLTEEVRKEASKCKQDYEAATRKAVEETIEKATEAAKAKAEEHQRDKQAAVVNAVQEAEQRLRQSLQPQLDSLQQQLDNEKQASQDAQTKATATEQSLLAELSAVKSRLESVPEPRNDPNPFGRDLRVPRSLQRPTIQIQKPESVQTRVGGPANRSGTEMEAEATSTSTTNRGAPAMSGNTPSQTSATSDAGRRGSTLPATSAQRDMRVPFQDLLASLSTPTSSERARMAAMPSSVANANNAPPTASSLPPLPGLQSETEAREHPYSRPIRSIRAPRLAPQTPVQPQHASGSDDPEGWTEEVTSFVRESLQQGDDIVQIEENIKPMYGVQDDGRGKIGRKLEKMRLEYEAENGDGMQQG